MSLWTSRIKKPGICRLHKYDIDWKEFEYKGCWSCEDFQIDRIKIDRKNEPVIITYKEAAEKMNKRLCRLGETKITSDFIGAIHGSTTILVVRWFERGRIKGSLPKSIKYITNESIEKFIEKWNDGRVKMELHTIASLLQISLQKAEKLTNLKKEEKLFNKIIANSISLTNGNLLKIVLEDRDLDAVKYLQELHSSKTYSYETPIREARKNIERLGEYEAISLSKKVNKNYSDLYKYI